MVEHVHTIVIGAGAVGLAMARRLAPQAGSLVVLEREDAIGTGTSSRNSEVIHAGRYYPAGTLKARSCVEGRRMLYSYCAERGIAHQRLGKLIVATEPAQRDALRQIAERAQVNGLTTPDDALQWLDAAQAQAREPALRCGRPPPASSTPTASCWPARVTWSVPGGLLALCTGFVGARRNGTHWRVRTRGEEGEYELLCTHLVNAAGLQAQRVAARIEGLDERHVPLALWLKGNYFSVSGVRPTTRSTRSARRSSMPPSAPTGRTCPTAPAASGLSSPGAGCQ